MSLPAPGRETYNPTDTVASNCTVTTPTTNISHTTDSVEARMKIELREIGIPPRPTILAQIENETRKDEPDFIHLARLLSSDVGLAAGMIKIANSPFFNFQKKVPTVQEALLVLGLRLVIKTVAGLALRQVFQHVPNMERFWDASAQTAEVAGLLARQLHPAHGVRPEDAFTFALFRDCGIPVLMIPFPEYRNALAQANNEAVLPFTAVEEAAMGVNHAEVGAQLAEDWLLPSEICQAIKHHHQRELFDPETPIGIRPRRLVALAQLAEHLIQLHTGQAQTCEWEKLGEGCLQTLDLVETDLKRLAADCFAELQGR